MSFRERLAAYDPGEWVQLPKWFVVLLTPRDAILLSSIINLYCWQYDRGRCVGEGWAYITNSQILNSSGLPKSTFQRGLASLKKLGLIHIHFEGMPRKRYLRVDHEKVHKHITERKAAWLSATPKRGDNKLRFRNLTKRTSQEGIRERGRASFYEKERTVATPKKFTVVSIEKDHALLFAQRLHKAISQARTLPPRSKPEAWAIDIRRMIKVDGRDTDVIDQILTWYHAVHKHEGDLIKRTGHYLPVAYSGKAFREKFDSMESAMGRWYQKKTGNPPPKKRKKPTHLDDAKPMTKAERKRFEEEW